MEGEYKDQYKEKLELKDVELPKDDSFIHLECPSCCDHVPASDININDKIAKCGNCNAVFSFAAKIPEDKPFSSTDITKDDMARPEGVEIMYYKDEMELILTQPHTWLNLLTIMIMPFVSFFAFLIYFVKDEGSLIVGIVALFLSILSGISMIRHERNKIYINVSKRKVKIEWRPKHLVKDKEFDTEDIEQVYVVQTGEGTSIYMVYNTTEGQKQQKLIGRMTSVIRAKFIEQEIEKYLGITNKKIAGEL